ncbi:MAG TPA: four helix bundle protein [Candidatus Paceibacterota bacterium]
MHTNNAIQNHKDLIVWQKSVDLSVFIYEITEKFPREEQFGLSSQMRRSSVSIASNIAEGRQRSTKKDFVNFLRIAKGSSSELETQLIISKRLNFSKNLNYSKIEALLEEVIKMLRAMIFKLTLPAKQLAS